MWKLSIILLLFCDSVSLSSLVWTTREIGAVIYLGLTLSWQHWLRPQHSSHYIASCGGACSENVFSEHFQCRSKERFQTLKLVWYSADLKARNIKFSIFFQFTTFSLIGFLVLCLGRTATHLKETSGQQFHLFPEENIP